MITGSHNPSEYNGFKTVCGTGTLHGKAIQEVYQMIQRRDFLTGQGTLQSIDIVTPYVDDISKQFNWTLRCALRFWCY